MSCSALSVFGLIRVVCKRMEIRRCFPVVVVGLFAFMCGAAACSGATIEIYPATVDSAEEFENKANSLQPGDELILHTGTYSQNGRRAVTAKGTAEKPIIIRAAELGKVLLTRPADNIDRHNNIEFVDCSHLTIRGLRFQGGSSGVRFIRGDHVTFEQCEIDGVDPTQNAGSIDCQAGLPTTDTSSASSEGQGRIVANRVTAYACYVWAPPAAGLLLIPQTVTFRAVISEPIQRQQ